MPIRHAFITILLLGSFASSTSAAVWVVDYYFNPGTTHQVIQFAVDSASDGDTILIRPGPIYDSFVVTGKSLVIAKQGEGVVRPPSIAVWKLSAGQSVVIRGLQTSQVSVTECQGAVRLEDLEVTTGSGTAVSIFNSASVALLRCDLVAKTTTSMFPSIFGMGVNVHNSHVYVSDSQLRGGAHNEAGKQGGPGLRVSQSTVTVSGSWLLGGGPSLFNPSSGCPGHGIEVIDTASTVRLLDCDFSLDFPIPGSCPVVPPITAPPGTVIQYTETARHIAVDSPLREPEVGTLSLQGVQGDAVLLLIGPATAHVDLPFHRGTLLVGPTSLAAVVVGPITNADGTLDIPFVVGELGPGGLAQTVQIQAAFIGSEGAILGPVSVLTALDSSL